MSQAASPGLETVREQAVPARLRFRRAAVALLAGAAAAGLSACAPDLGPAPKVKPIGTYQTQQSLPPSGNAAFPPARWWEAYGDPELSALIEEALKNNPDIAEAYARVRLASAQAEQAGAANQPQLNASGSVKETKIELAPGILPPNVQLPPSLKDWNATTQLGASASYAFDFFGANRNRIRAALGQARAAEVEAQEGALQISAAVASAYANLVRLYADLDDAQATLKLRQQTLDLVGQRLRNGLETRGEFAQQRGTVPQAQQEIEQINAQILVTRHQLGALLGQGPDRGLSIPRPAAPRLRAFGVPANLPAELLGRRPDIVAARLTAEAAARQVKAARADFYPNINLAASYTDLSIKPEDIFRKNIQLTQIGPTISLPIFSGGRLQGAYRGARANYDVAVAAYDRAVTNALQEIADTVSNQRALQAQLANARDALAAAEEAYKVATLRYQGGLSPYLNVLTAENTVVAQRRVVADLSSQAFILDVTLARQLGGGFVDPTAVATTTADLR